MHNVTDSQDIQGMYNFKVCVSLEFSAVQQNINMLPEFFAHDVSSFQFSIIIIIKMIINFIKK